MAALVAVVSAGSAVVGQGPEIIDAHMHYSRPAWDEVPPAAVLAKMAAAGVSRAAVSSTPDDGTLKLHGAAPDLFVKFLRPYRTRGDMEAWYTDPDVADYIEQRLKQGGYRGLGEFHLEDPAGVGHPVMRRVLALAGEYNLILHAHSNAGVIDALFAAAPDLTILWAHAGMNDPPDAIAELLARHPRLYADLSFRAADVGDGERIRPEWLELFGRFPDRLMVGSDTYVSERWFGYGEIIDEFRVWLDQLPPNIARAVASENAKALLGD
ncbi:MAG: amidohydrolase family protein [Alphaproteobacteria bacterium]